MKSPSAESEEVFLVKEERIERLERLIDALDAAARRISGGHNATSPLPSAIRAQCVRCGAEIPGPDLMRLAQVPSSDDEDWLRLLRKAHCANPRCASSYYRVHFLKHPGVDWSAVFAKGSEITETPTSSDVAEPPVVRARHRIVGTNAVRIGILVGVLLVALLARHIYHGGTIPIVREPEHFKVGVLPDGQKE